MNSKIIKGSILHGRMAPVRHAFRYSYYTYLFDLDELAKLDRCVAGFGYNRLCPLAIHDSDYMEAGPGSIRDKLLLRLGPKRAERVDNILLVTHPRFFHYIFNPVSFYYCFRRDGELECCVAEVNNTFGEKHVYVVDDLRRVEGGWVSRMHRKAFHVSPFNDMEGEYRFFFSEPGERVEIVVDLMKEGRVFLRAKVTGGGCELNTRSLWMNIARHPLVAWLTMPRILWQAGVLYYRRKLRVFTKPEPRSPDTIRHVGLTRLERFAERKVCGYLGPMNRGRLVLVLPDGTERSFGDAESKAVVLKIRRWNFFKRVMFAGDIGFAEAWMAGDFDCDDIRRVLDVFIENRDVLDVDGPVAALLGRAWQKTRHWLRHNSLAGSRRNIEAHYDLSNDFFETFLDQTMTYSCGLYPRGDESLEEAQHNKLQAAIRKARIGADDHVLEIGTGWGSFAIEAARTTGCRVTSITLSGEQKVLAEERIREAGLEERIEVRICDYRKMTGQFDRIVSIEMLEAVGHAHFGDYFAALERLLKPGGLVFLQVITIPDQRYEAYRKGVDFIQAHIFPGGLLPSLGVMCENMRRRSKLSVEHLENFADHYVRTLREWRWRFKAHEEVVVSLGFDEAFRRKWEYYLAYCEAGFDHRMIHLLQLVLARDTLPAN